MSGATKCRVFCAFLAFMLCGEHAIAIAQSVPSPNLVTERSREHTGFQEASPYRPRSDLRTDFVMAYGLNPSLPERLERWRAEDYVAHVMTGVAWGDYQDYLDGKVDGLAHWDEGQVAADGSPILHGPRVPYMVPTVAFAEYLEHGIRKAIDGGAVAIHLEEPEFWARAGFSEAFQREWKIFYREPWQRPDESVDAQYRASKLKYYLYRRTLDRLCSAMKEYAQVKYGRDVRFFVPTHSLLNYAQWQIVSPESALLDLPGVDGYIAQVWTGTARTANTYRGVRRERTFETAYLEYGVMQELVRGTSRRMWFLHDPIEDNPRHDWTDYRTNYIRTLTASLLHPEVWHYEVCPWPSRVYHGQYPRGAEGITIPDDYATTLAVVFNQLRDMQQTDVSFPDSTTGIGVFLSDSAMFQRATPAFDSGVTDDELDRTRPTSREVRMLSGYYGLALPLLKHGIPVRPVQLDNLARTPGYLDDLKVVVLSYEFMKPLSPGLHLALARWVERGGVLIYAGADTDPFHAAQDWWNREGSDYGSPAEHLFETLGLERVPAEGNYRVKEGHVWVERCHPAWFSRSADSARRLRQLVREAVATRGDELIERNSIQLRRGPYVIAAVLDESLDEKPLELQGQFVDLLEPTLAVRDSTQLAAGEQGWWIDLSRISGERPLLLAAAGRVEQWNVTDSGVEYVISSPEGTNVSTRIALEQKPTSVTVDGNAIDNVTWHEASRTVLIRHAGSPTGVAIRIE